MSMYYHEFTVGFNFWEILLPLEVLIMIVPAIMRYKIRAQKIHSVVIMYSAVEMYSRRLLIVVAGILTALFCVLFVIESCAGVVQFLDNNLSATDSGAWSLILLPIAIVSVVFVVFFLLYGAGIIFSWVVLGRLTEESKDLKKMEERRYRRLEKARAHAKRRIEKQRKNKK